MKVGTLRALAVWGVDWPKYVQKFDDVHSLAFDYTDVYPSRGPYSRYHAYPLRCLSTALEG